MYQFPHLRLITPRFFTFFLVCGIFFNFNQPPASAALTDEDIATLNVQQPDRNAAAPAPKPVEPSLPGIIGRMTLALGVVFTLMLGVMWLMKRYMPQTVGNLRGGPIEVLATRGIGGRKSLLLVRAKDKTILLGISQHNIQFLTEVEQDGPAWQESSFQTGLEREIVKAAAADSPRPGTTGLEERA